MDDHLTSPGTMLGTVAYMSPEQVRAKELDARSDLFSFGAVLYEMATGASAVSRRKFGDDLQAILNRAPYAAVRLNPDVPPELEDIINQALEKDRELRYQSAADMRSELQAAEARHRVGTSHSSSPARWRPHRKATRSSTPSLPPSGSSSAPRSPPPT